MYIIQNYFTGEEIGTADTFQQAREIADGCTGSQVVLKGEILYTNIELPF